MDEKQTSPALDQSCTDNPKENLKEGTLPLEQKNQGLKGTGREWPLMEIGLDKTAREYRDACSGSFTRMSYGVLDLGPSGYRNDHKKKADRFPCRRSDLSSEFHAWKNTYLKEEKKKSTHNKTWMVDDST